MSAKNAILAERMQRLDMAKKKFAATKERLTKEINTQNQLEEVNKMAENEYKESEQMRDEVEKEIRKEKDELFKESQKLFKLRAEQANLIGDISGTLSASRNLQANITKLEHEKTRQQELLYAADFQIQDMERKVARQLGERSQEEMKKLNDEIEMLKKQQESSKENLNKLVTSNKQLQDERRIIERQIEKLEASKTTLKSTIDELNLINVLAETDLKKVTEQKEKKLV